jgi:hypothetical protein
MSDELREFFELKQRYQAANALVRTFLLDEKFEALATNACNPALRKSVRDFIEVERAEQRRRREIWKAEFQREREERDRERQIYVTKRMEVMDRWLMGTVQRSTARTLIEASAWWLTHSSGNPVRAPKHADRIESGKWGWSIEFGANHFLITKFVQESTPCLIEGFDLIRKGEILNRKFFVQRVRSILPTCVANYNYDRYERYEPTYGQLVFGAQAIDQNDAANSLIDMAGIARYCLSAP